MVRKTETMRKLIIAYIRFWFKSTNQHGVHSPFVYNLVTQCFYDKRSYPNYKALLNYRTDLLNNTNTIEVTDLGAGSQVMVSHIRSVKAIAKNAGSTRYRAKLLLRLVHYFKFKNILELGTSLGIATYAMHLGNTKAKITTIEGCPNIANFTKAQLNHYNTSNITIKTGDFAEVIPSLKSETYDFIYIDGNHQKQATLHYFNELLDCAHNNTVFIFDDINWSQGMFDAWKTIVNHPRVTVSIDTFFWGFVFLRTEQTKEHFTIRL